MGDIYRLPDDVTALTDDDLEANLTAATRSFRNVSQTTTVTASTLPNLRELKAAITALKAEQADRTAAAEAAAAEIDALSADVFGDPNAETDGDGATDAAAADTETAATDGDAGETAAVEPTDVKTAEEVAASAGTRRARLDLSAIRARQSGRSAHPSAYEPEERHQIEITASVDVPGYRPGQDIELADITEGVIRRATGLKTSGGGTGIVANYTLPFPNELIVKDASSAPEGSLATLKASDQRRLAGGDLVASGGWCAPSETVYSITDIACPDMLWDLPEVQIARGGLRFFRTPVLDVTALTWVHTEQDDIAGNTKPCFVIPCPAPLEVRAEAQGVCLQAGILTERYFPELVDWYVRNSMVAHEIRLKSSMYDRARTASTAVTTTVSFAAFSAVYAAVALQAADMIERYNLCEGTELEVVFPFWVKNMFLADIARQQGVKPQDLDPAIIQSAFSQLGVRVQFARGLAPDVPANIGNATAAVQWPTDVEFLIYPSGNFQLGRGPEINLGVIIDSTTVSTNDQKIFSEEGVMLIDRLGLSRRVTVAVCASGQIGPQAAAAVCPIA
jgi:hypothetical protein